MKTSNNIFDTGYGVISNSVSMDTRLTTTARAIYAALASYAGNKKYAYPTIPTLCHAVGITKNTLNKHMTYLLAYGYIIKKQYKTAESKFANNIYVIQDQPEENKALVSKLANKKLSHKNNSLPIFKETEIIEAVSNVKLKYVQKNIVIKEEKKVDKKIEVPIEDAKAIQYLVEALGQSVSEKDVADIYQDAKGKIDVIKAKYEVVKQAGFKIIKRPVGVLRKAIQENWQANEEKPCTNFPYTKNVTSNNNIRKFINDDVNKELLKQQLNCKNGFVGKTEKEKAKAVPTIEQKEEMINCFKQKNIIISEMDILDLFSDAKGEVCTILNYFETFIKTSTSPINNPIGLLRRAMQGSWTPPKSLKPTQSNTFNNFTNRVYDPEEMKKVFRV